MSLAQLLKRALVSVLLEVSRTYCLDLSLSRDSADADVKKAFRRVIVKAHPDKPGGSVSATVRLNEAWARPGGAKRRATRAKPVDQRSHLHGVRLYPQRRGNERDTGYSLQR